MKTNQHHRRQRRVYAEERQKEAVQTLGGGRAGYYAHARGGASRREQENARLRPQVRQIFWEHKRRYGARRIAAELAARGETCGPRRASRLLKQLGLQAIQPRSFRP